jgi:hypothetical protein
LPNDSVPEILEKAMRHATAIAIIFIISLLILGLRQGPTSISATMVQKVYVTYNEASWFLPFLPPHVELSHPSFKTGGSLFELVFFTFQDTDVARSNVNRSTSYVKPLRLVFWTSSDPTS